jgi:hypothetical protein
VGVPSVPTTGPAVGQPALGPGEPGEGQTPENPAKIQGTVNEELQARLTGKGGELKTPMVSDTYLKVAAQIKTLQGIEAPATQRAETGLAAGGGGAAPPALPLTKVSDSEWQAGGKVKPVRIAPQAGATVSGYDLLMNQAEKKLADGNYLDAAVQFQNALALKPDDPLALIGRAHAWLGAGVYAGADTDLKFAFTRNPELIGLRYQENSFVPAKRQEYLLDDLQKATEKKGMANMASFLYCYVCYETGRTDLLQAELKKWAAQPGHDEWAEVAARAWGGAK